MNLLHLLLLVSNVSKEDYWKNRAELENAEQQMHLGSKLQLSKNETELNKILMAEKHAEFQAGLESPVDFLPSMNFLKAKPLIEQSKVFQIIQKMPKGAVLHAHDTALVSTDFLYNLTFVEHLYICETANKSEIQFKFALTAPAKTVECADWQLLSDRRKEANADELNKKIKSSFTLLVENPDEVYFDVNEVWKKFYEIFTAVDGLLNYRPVLEEYFYQVFKEIYSDNIMHLEFRGTLPQTYELNGTLYNEVEVVGLYRNVAKRFEHDFPDFSVKFIYAPPRLVNQTVFDKYLETAKILHNTYPDFVAGFDLVGQEDAGLPLTEFADKLNKLNMNYFFHAGETNWKGMTDMNLIDAVLLGAKRIGHGYAITKHPLLMELIKEKQIAVEISPISNQVLNLVKDLRNHPGAVLFSDDYPVIISHDDPSFWGAVGLSYDFYEAFMAFAGYDDDIRVLKQLGLNSIKFSSMSDAWKNETTKLFESKWSQFVDKMIAEINN